MRQKSFLVPAEVDEVEALVAGWQAADRNPGSFSMIVNPTFGCNLRCWYCYEEHGKMPLMKPFVLASIYRLLERKTTDPALRRLNVSFFGGEPLLGFKDVVAPLLAFAARLSREKGLVLTSNFTTNGVLLTDEVLDTLEKVGLTEPATFQISLDGNKDYHDRSRVEAPTYDIIVRHMRNAARRRFPVFARLSYTADGYETAYKSVHLVWKKKTTYAGIRNLPMRRKSLTQKDILLDELTVTATKIKFYLTNDTLVYNADAFQLQEGSLLDGLIAQFPGAELKSDGQIFVNGKKVESLLLNGRDFFKGDNTVLLDNLPAYMAASRCSAT